MPSLKEDLLLTLLDHVTFDIDTGCWLMGCSLSDKHLCTRIAYEIWHDGTDEVLVLSDRPSCSWPNSVICISPMHRTNYQLIYRRVDAGASV